MPTPRVLTVILLLVAAGALALSTLWRRSPAVPERSTFDRASGEVGRTTRPSPLASPTAEVNGDGSPSDSAAPESRPANQSTTDDTRRTFTSKDYDFTLTYPATFGEVTIEQRDQDECGGTGARLLSRFADDPRLSFGFTTAAYRPCPHPITVIEVKEMAVQDERLELTLADGSRRSLAITATLPTTSPGINAYVFENSIDSGAAGALTAIVKGPNTAIGPLVFQTHGLNTNDALALLKLIVSD